MNILLIIRLLLEMGISGTLCSTGSTFDPRDQIRISIAQDFAKEVEYNFEYSDKEWISTFKEKEVINRAG